MDVNANVSECVFKQYQFGQTLVTNICNGVSTSLPWQFGEWAEAVVLGALGLFVLGIGVMLTFVIHSTR